MKALVGIVGLFFLTGCGTTQDTAGDDSSDNDRIISREDDEKAVSENLKIKGIIRDESIKDGCGFLIEVNMMGNKTYYQPHLLGEEFKEDGLEVSFTYTRSRRQSTCEMAVPIILDSIEK